MRAYRYRVSYGNGQVSEIFDNKMACVRLILESEQRNEPYTKWFRVEFQDPDTGEWFRQRISIQAS